MAHLRLAVSVADRYWMPGFDRDDLRQEAAAALVEAAACFRSDGRDFAPFAATVIRRRLWDAIKASQTDRRRANRELAESEIALEHLPDVREVDRAAGRARLRAVVAALPSLTSLERESLAMSLRGEPYWESTSADNACQRARRKLRAAVEEAA